MPKKADTKKVKTTTTNAKSTATKKATPKKSLVKKTTVKKVAVKKAPVKKAAVKKAAVKKAPVKKAAVKKTAVKKVAAKKTPAKKVSAKKRTTPISSYQGRKGEKYMSAAMKKHFLAVLIDWREHLKEEMQKIRDYLADTSNHISAGTSSDSNVFQERVSECNEALKMLSENIKQNF